MSGRPAPGQRASAGWAFFLDVDGTLLDFASDPRAVKVDAALTALLARLLDVSAGAVALISGRTLRDLDALFSPLVLPAAGQHGAERRPADRLRPRPSARRDDLRPAIRDLGDFAAMQPGVLVEDKGMTVAVHFRQRPEIRAAVLRETARVAARLGPAWRLQEGSLTSEITPAGRDKGVAIAEFMSEPPFAGRVAVFVGDDLSDEHGFAMVNELGGLSLKVGGGDTAARWRLRDVSAVRAWLAACAERLSRE
ncbi:MAG TPA: trehalose-phosphatase [Candidatus Bathyarchaeia archaeon]|nr:trehalose-phosphatase [Candidatus Bathyarchaeia archaeon]